MTEPYVVKARCMVDVEISIHAESEVDAKRIFEEGIMLNADICEGVIDKDAYMVYDDCIQEIEYLRIYKEEDYGD